MAKTLFDRVWEAHLVAEPEGEAPLLYVDLHLVHEVTSAQAFEGLRLAGRKVRRPELTLATMDHNVPTDDRPADELAAAQLGALRRNCEEFGIRLYATGSGREGIVHVIGPELGLSQPGMTIVCGDSHTSTHGALGALAFGIGTSEVEHVLATQTLPQRGPKTMLLDFSGSLPLGVTAKDVILGAIGRIGVAGAAGYVVEYAGEVIRALPMSGRMTICNMSIEAGARAGMIAPDDTTFAFLEGRPALPRGAEWERVLDRWRALPSDPDATYDCVVELDVGELAPQVSWGTSSPTPRTSTTLPSGRPPSGRSCTWRSSRARRSGRSRSTASSSARARTRGSRTCARPPPSSPANVSIRACAPSSSPARPASSDRPRTRGSTGSSRRQDSSGGGPAAPCAWA
jgi:3-isopropylmalate/(R)-2-methylmalate dehydratase large subunit